MESDPIDPCAGLKCCNARPDPSSFSASSESNYVVEIFFEPAMQADQWGAASGVRSNVEVTGAARHYRAASVWTAGLGRTRFICLR